VPAPPLTYMQGVEAFRVADRLSESNLTYLWVGPWRRSIAGQRKIPDSSFSGLGDAFIAPSSLATISKVRLCLYSGHYQVERLGVAIDAANELTRKLPPRKGGKVRGRRVFTIVRTPGRERGGEISPFESGEGTRHRRYAGAG
jgi:hypothetical protein